ncbi:hypothetical protein VTN00DRAFT_527 [Thermoascus crustaceus]|uniref:uncharacterized protein n=1 Tax=Thermoascus crustaceus TaxID=5088 RepID=UPI0037422175
MNRWPIALRMDHVFTTSTSTSHDSCRLRRSFRGRAFYYPPHSPPLSTSPPPHLKPPPDKPFSLQTRRLQLRNAGFRAPQLPGRRISDNLTAWRSTSGGSQIYTDNENKNGPDPSSTQDHNSNSSSSRRRVNVLQEINNSTERHHRQPFSRPSVRTLFQQDVPQDNNSNSEDLFLSPCPSKERGFLTSPISFDQSQSDGSDTEQHAMKSRDQSARGGSPLLYSSSSITRRKRRNDRRPGYGTTRYIEHLETQLAASQNELDAVNSSASRPQISRLRSRNAEIRMLKQELAEWESKFEHRVREEMDSRTETVSKLKARIRELEGQVEADHRKINELEYENEMQAQKLRDAEALSSTNRNLERRIDVLTELLAQSPTKLEQSRNSVYRSGGVSPGGPRLARPKSMISCIPSPQNGGICQPPVFPGAKAGNDLSDASDPLVGDADSKSAGQRESIFDDQAKSGFTSESTSVTRDSMFLSSAPRSQRSSMISQYSSASSVSLPFPISPDSLGKFQSRHKKMRRFPSGSCTLKPLILPVATGDHHPSSSRQSVFSPKRELQASFDPTTAFHDDQEYDNPSTNHRRDPSWAQQESLNALEGRTDYYETFEEAISRLRTKSDVSPNLGQRLDMDLDNALRSRSHEETIPEGDEDFYFESESAPQAPTSDASQNHIVGGRRDHMPTILLSSADDYAETPTRHLSTRYRKYLSDKDRTKAKNKELSTAITKSSPAAGVAPRQAVGILSRYLSYFRELQRHPTELARRVIANAWHSNWQRMGKLSWWVLGLFLGPQSRDNCFRRQPSSEADDYDWHRYSGAIHLKRSTLLDHPPVIAHGCRLDANDRLHGQATYGNQRLQCVRHEIPESFPEEPPRRTSSFGRSLCLWAKFSFAVVLAIGMAVKDGPETLLEDRSRSQFCQDRCHPECKSLIPRSKPKPAPRYPDTTEEHRYDASASDISGSTALDDDPPQTHGWMPNLAIDNFLTG